VQTKGNAKATKPVASRLVRDAEAAPPPRHRLPDEGAGGDITYDIITNELFLDGSARLNLATFVTTWMPPHAARLMADTADKNMIDKDEYPQTAELERCCVNILGDLWHAPGDGDATGTSTTGSSEAAMLGGMALKWRKHSAPIEVPALAIAALTASDVDGSTSGSQSVRRGRSTSTLSPNCRAAAIVKNTETIRGIPDGRSSSETDDPCCSGVPFAIFHPTWVMTTDSDRGTVTR
jgi:hypothetical protein